MEEARNDLTYLQLITNQNLFDASFAAHEALKKSPNSLAAMSLSAVAHLKNNDPALADAIYKDKLIPWSTAPDPWKNVRAAVLYATGKKSEADELVSTIDKNQLRPEERALLPAD
jgi:Flp pilus assembly protein TadD